MPPPPTAKRHPAGEADGGSDGDAGRVGQPRSSLAAAGGADHDREAPGKTFDFERILEDFVLLTFLARPTIAASGPFPSAHWSNRQSTLLQLQSLGFGGFPHSFQPGRHMCRA